MCVATTKTAVSTVTTERIPTEQVRLSLHRAIAGWGFGAAFSNITAGAIYVSFARSLGADDRVFGLFAAAMPMMGFLQIFAARIVERTMRRKQLMLTAGIAGRLLWTLAALLPLVAQVFPGVLSRDQLLFSVVGAIFIAMAVQAFIPPPFFSWMSDLVPRRVMPTFIARRMQVGIAVSLVASLASGWIADSYPALQTYCVLLALAGLAGVLDIAFFIGVPEPQRARSEEDAALPPLLASLREPLQDRTLRNFMRFAALMAFGYGMMGPFMWLHALEFFGMSKTSTILALTVAPMLGGICTSRFWGDVVKSHGSRPVMRFCAAGLTLLPLAWLVATPNTFFLLAGLMFLSGMLMSAMELTSQNVVVGLSGHIPRSTVVALWSISWGISYAVASCCSGSLAFWLRDFHGELFGLPLINYHILFFLSLCVRLVTTFWIAPRLHEPGATGTRQAVKDVSTDIVEMLSARIPRPFLRRES